MFANSELQTEHFSSEKVLADGSPAAVAPLGWSAACVLLALDALDG